MLIKAHITATGGVLPALVPQPDDNQIIPEPCPWCEGTGQDGEDHAGWACQRCNGTGSIGTMTQGEARKRHFEEQVFYLDATRYESMDRDICPDCGAGGFGCCDTPPHTCPKATRVHYIKNYVTGEVVPHIKVDR